MTNDQCIKVLKQYREWRNSYYIGVPAPSPQTLITAINYAIRKLEKAYKHKPLTFQAIMDKFADENKATKPEAKIRVKENRKIHLYRGIDQTECGYNSFMSYTTTNENKATCKTCLKIRKKQAINEGAKRNESR